MFAGFALGPILSSVLLSYAQTWFNITDPTQIVLIPFYIALSSHLVYLGLLCLALPESLSESRREASQKRYEDDLKVRREFELEADERASERGRVKVWARRVARNVARLFGFLRPLGLLLPKKLGPRDGEDDERPPEEELRTNIEWGQDLKEYWTPEDTWNHIEDGGRGRNKRDWSLTKIALAYAAYMSVIVSLPCPLRHHVSLLTLSRATGHHLGQAPIRELHVRLVSSRRRSLPLLHRSPAGRSAPRLPTPFHPSAPSPLARPYSTAAD